jgi:hypothetical protein
MTQVTWIFLEEIQLSTTASELAACAQAKFIPMLRLYWPKETPPSIIDGSWTPPSIN